MQQLIMYFYKINELVLSVYLFGKYQSSKIQLCCLLNGTVEKQQKFPIAALIGRMKISQNYAVTIL